MWKNCLKVLSMYVYCVWSAAWRGMHKIMWYYWLYSLLVSFGIFFSFEKNQVMRIGGCFVISSDSGFNDSPFILFVCSSFADRKLCRKTCVEYSFTDFYAHFVWALLWIKISLQDGKAIFFGEVLYRSFTVLFGFSSFDFASESEWTKFLGEFYSSCSFEDESVLLQQ